MSLVRAEKLVKTYRSGEVEVQAVRGVDFAIEPRSLVAFVGPSGSGKTTLLNMIGCLDHPTSGKLTVADTDVASLDRRAAANFRGRHMGFIFQDFNLIPVLSAYENVEYPLLLLGTGAAERRARTEAMLESVGLTAQRDHRPNQLSGGQKQRVAIARALVKGPELVLADEPTANLDSHTGAAIIELMRKVQHERAATFIFSTHDPQLISHAEETYAIRDGKLVEHRSEAA